MDLGGKIGIAGMAGIVGLVVAFVTLDGFRGSLSLD